MKDFSIAIGEKIKEIRVTHQYTQKDFAQNVLKISTRNLVRIEKGDSPVSVELLLTMADNLKLDVQELLFDVLDRDGMYEAIKKVILKLERNPSAQADIFRELDELYHNIDEMTLSTAQRDELDWLYMVFTFKQTEDHQIIDYFLQKTKYVPVLKLKAINCTQSGRTSSEIRMILDGMLTNEAKFFTVTLVKEGTPIAIFSNSIGYLLEREDLTNVATYLKHLKKYIIRNEKYYFLPIYYYRCAQFAYLENDVAVYERNKKNHYNSHVCLKINRCRLN